MAVYAKCVSQDKDKAVLQVCMYVCMYVCTHNKTCHFLSTCKQFIDIFLRYFVILTVYGGEPLNDGHIGRGDQPILEGLSAFWRLEM